MPKADSALAVLPVGEPGSMLCFSVAGTWVLLQLEAPSSRAVAWQ